MRIFYFNITYGCNSNCIFCYSHNTKHNSEPFHDISVTHFFGYLDDNHLNSHDRVIINGGEPILHPFIMNIFEGLLKYGCEVLVYTNGRLLKQLNLSCLTSNFRFIIPVHGYEEIHDSITRVKGSYRETIKGLEYLVEKTQCLVDVKLIINEKMIKEDPRAIRVLKAFDNEITMNHAVHLTQMADTIISKKNGCQSIKNEDSSLYLKILYSYFCKRGTVIKIFDTCIKKIQFLSIENIERYDEPIQVLFKDYNQFRLEDLHRIEKACMRNCQVSDVCLSAVNEYKALVIEKEKMYESLE